MQSRQVERACEAFLSGGRGCSRRFAAALPSNMGHRGNKYDYRQPVGPEKRLWWPAPASSQALPAEVLEACYNAANEIYGGSISQPGTNQTSSNNRCTRKGLSAFRKRTPPRRRWGRGSRKLSTNSFMMRMRTRDVVARSVRDQREGPGRCLTGLLVVLRQFGQFFRCRPGQSEPWQKR